MNEHLVRSDRIEHDLLELAEIGRRPGEHGVNRPAFSEADMAGRRWLLERLAALGLPASLDGAGNVIGTLGGGDQPSVIIGSHLDTVPEGGIFDGALGVVAGLECLRVVKEQGIRTRHPLQLVAFSDEEGKFGGMLGSRAMAGLVTLDWIETAADPDGLTLSEAMKSAGLDPLAIPKAYRPPDTVRAFLELHIEQGPVLDQKGPDLGIVETISGVYVWVVHLIGKADHSGTAPMDMRSDAFMGLADFAHEIPRIIEEEGSEHSRLTVGKVDLLPGFPHTVPGQVAFTLVGRDDTRERMEALANSCRRVLSALARRHRLMFEYHEMSWLDPKPCDPAIIELLDDQAKLLGWQARKMSSGAGHDTQSMTEIAPSGMIFVPSKGGISHAPDEWTNWHDIERGTTLLLRSALELAEVEQG